MVAKKNCQLFAALVAALFFTQCSSPEFSSTQVELNFEKNHSEDVVTSSSLRYRKFSSGLFNTLFFEYQPIRIVIPGGRTFTQKVELGNVDIKNGQLYRIKTAGGPMPIEQAKLVGEIFHQQFQLPNEKLAHWYEQNKAKGRSIEPYSISANLRTYPRVSFAIRPSMNRLYNCKIALQISWDWKKQKHMNEELAEMKNQPPPDGMELISLEPPSGKTYDRRFGEYVPMFIDVYKKGVILLLIPALVAVIAIALGYLFWKRFHS